MSLRNFNANIIAEPKTQHISNTWALFAIAFFIGLPVTVFVMVGLFPKVYEIFRAVYVVGFIPVVLLLNYISSRKKKKKEDITGSFSWQGEKMIIRRNTDTNGAMEFDLKEISYVNFYPDILVHGATGSGTCIVRCDLCVGKTHQRFHLLTEDNSYTTLADKCSEFNLAGYKVNCIPE